MKALLILLALASPALAQPFDIYGWKEVKTEKAWVDSKHRKNLCAKYDAITYNEWASRMHLAAPLVVYQKPHSQ